MFTYNSAFHLSLSRLLLTVFAHMQGEVFLKFDNVSAGERAVKALNGRWFGGKQASVISTLFPVTVLSFSSDLFYYNHRLQLHLCLKQSIMLAFRFRSR
jgi:hypothetical protein